MTLQEYIRIIRTRGWLVLIAILVCALAAYGVSRFQEDLYRATVYVSTVPARADYGLGVTAKDLLRNFVLNIRTPENAATAIDRAKLDQNPYEFLSNVTVADDASTFTIRIDAEARDPQVAKDMALSLADLFVEERTLYYAQQDKRDRIEVKIVSRDINAPQIQPKPIINAVAGGVLGLLFGIGLVLALTWMEADLLRTPTAVERTLELPVLAAIPIVAEQAQARSPDKTGAIRTAGAS